jgi:hypothetical protein
MFDEVLKAIKKLDGFQESVAIPCDDDGHLDRLCPADDCDSRFKVFGDDWRDRVPDETAWCPSCGRSDDPSDFLTDEQRNYLTSIAGYRAQQAMYEGLKASERSPRRQRRRGGGGMFSMTTEVKVRGPAPTRPAVMDPWDQMRSKHTCSKCGCRFAIVGAWFYCPACGKQDPLAVFSQSLAGIRHAMSCIDEALAPLDADIAADMRRRTIEGNLGGLVTTFQVVVEALYSAIPSAPSPGMNAFQNLDRGSELWENVGGTRFEELLGSEDYSRAKLLCQRRHIFQHRDGVVDQRYLNQSGDQAYRVGERLVANARDVLELAGLVESLVSALRSNVPGVGSL